MQFVHALKSANSLTFRLLAALIALTLIPSWVDAASPANRTLAVDLLWELGADDIETAGMKIQRLSGPNRTDLAQCFANLRDLMQRASKNETDAQDRLPASMRRKPSTLAPLALAAQLAYEFATGAPTQQTSMTYGFMLQMQVARKQSQEMLKNPQLRQMFESMGINIDAMKQWGDQETKRNLMTLMSMLC
jgi:hypothetical protein